MRKLKFTESQIVAILAEGESGLAVGDVCRKSWSKVVEQKQIRLLDMLRELDRHQFYDCDIQPNK